MTREAFGSSMFELADIWTENICEEEVGQPMAAARYGGGGGGERTHVRFVTR